MPGPGTMPGAPLPPPSKRGSNPIDPLTGKKKRGRPKKPEGAPISHHKKPKKTKKEVAAEKAAKEAAAAASASGGQNSEGAARESVDSQDSGNSNSQQQYPQPTQNHQVHQALTQIYHRINVKSLLSTITQTRFLCGFESNKSI